LTQTASSRHVARPLTHDVLTERLGGVTQALADGLLHRLLGATGGCGELAEVVGVDVEVGHSAVSLVRVTTQIG
jgi:hypothetical protein